MSGAQVAVAVYCERAGDGLWAEPLNALSNLGFVLTALLILRRLHATGLPPHKLVDLLLLDLALMAIGIGSLLWHTLATPWSEWADVIPILLFISVYLVAFMRRIGGLGPLPILTGFLLYHLVNTTVQLGVSQQLLNGSIFYLPTLLVLLLFSLYTLRIGHRHARDLVFASGLFCLSLLLRTLDQSLCSVWPFGTHFLWHLLNAWVLYRLTLALLPEPVKTPNQR